MLKAMVFVDADWLCASALDVSGPFDRPDLQIDHRRMSGVLADEIGRRHHLGPIDVVRSHYFMSRPRNYAGRDQALVQRRRELVARLAEEPRIELEVVDVDPGDRSSGGDGDRATGAPGVHVAMTVAAMRSALTPGVLDVAIFVLGDRDFAPLLQELRRLGRRVALASIEGSCARDLADPANPLRVADFEVLWLNEVIGRIEKWRGGRPARPAEDPVLAEEEVGASLRGRIKNVIWDRGYGFIAADDGRDYFFHVNALEAGLEFDELQPDLAVSFEVKSGPVRGRAGAARLVRRDLGIDGAVPARAPAAAENGPEALPDQPPAAQPGAEAASEPGFEDDTLAPAGSDREESRS
ncbi:MAG: cold shock domain-containing protein [Geminicoccaceae bacterium]